MNSVNPFRLEGQKTIMYRILEGLNWEVPDWIVVPGGNLGNCSAFGKAYEELLHLGLVKKAPRLAIINAHGANTLHTVVNTLHMKWNGGHIDNNQISGLYAGMDEANYHPHTVASAIEISRPVNLKKSLRALDVMNGVVAEVTDEAILEAKALIGRYGFGCEPASAATVAGLQQLLKNGTIGRNERVACILTGHGLKDPDATVHYHTGIQTKNAKQPPAEPTWGSRANKPIPVADNMQAILAALGMSKDTLEETVPSGYKETATANFPTVEY
jgi:threonine synthase